MREVLDALKARERALDRREQSLISREADLRAVERDLEARIDELKVARTGLQAMLQLADEAQEARIKALVKMVESMRAGEAAKMVAELPDPLAVAVLDRMRASKAGKLLAKMAPVKAASLAEKLANEPQSLSGNADAGGD
jgi:flagellar motility protein MotE (MotC chaperone)